MSATGTKVAKKSTAKATKKAKPTLVRAVIANPAPVNALAAAC
jgi:hypothetical protein